MQKNIKKDVFTLANQNQNIEQNIEQTEEQLSEVLQIRREKLAELRANNKDPYQITTYDVDTYAKDINESYDKYEGKTVAIAGRMMSKRIMGKASFAHISDRSGKVQIYIGINVVGEDSYKEFGKWDLGDIIGVKGEVFKTKTGEITVKAHEMILLSKSLRPLPEKWHGLKDTDMRYRQRYLDLIVNPEVKSTFEKRSATIRSIRNFLDSKGYLEVETPVLHSIAGGAAARPFITHHNTLDIDMYLRIALELHLKRLVVGGFDRVYEIGRVFRNEGMSVRHNPEFTMLEFYQAYTDYVGMMDLGEALIRDAAQNVNGTTRISYSGTEIDFGVPFKRITMVDAVKEYSGVDFDKITDLEEARKAAKEHNIQYEERHLIGDILNLFFEEYVEEKLIQPTFVMGHPVEISPLAKKNPKDPRYTERFELFIYGRELANGFSELNDPIDQKERFLHQLELKAQGDDEANDMDEDFINALEIGLPPTGGIGIGIDRLVMLLTDSASIRDVLLFPTMKPIGGEKKAEAAATAQVVTAPKNAPEKIDFSKVEIEPLFKDEVDFETFQKSDFRAVKVKECEAVPKSKKLLKFVLDDGSGEDRVILSGIHAYYEPEDLIGKTLLAITNLPPRKMMGIDSCGMLISAIHSEEGEERLNLIQLDAHIPAGAKMY